MKLKLVIVAAVAGLSLLSLGFVYGRASASTADPGSAADPLVSKSYVDQMVAGLADKAYIDGRLAEVASKGYVDGKTGFQVVTVPKGASLIGESGTEIVLRGGKATAIVSAKGGVLDATGGFDMFQDQAVAPNHLLIIPVSDGRGVLAQTDLILIVKGTYTVKPAVQ